MTETTGEQLLRNRRILGEEGAGKIEAITPEAIAPSQREALKTTLTPQTIGQLLGTEVAKTDEEVNPADAQVIRYMEVGDRPNNDSGVDENAGSSPLGTGD